MRYVGMYTFGMGVGYVAALLDGKSPDLPLSLMITGLGALAFVCGCWLSHLERKEATG